MIERRFRKLWDHLQARKLHMPHFLSAVRLQGIRGIDDLRVTFDYPVSVVAGGNASGKSTVLFAAACAYRVPGAGVRDFAPSTLFPDYRPGPRGVGEVPPNPAAGRRPGHGVPSSAVVGGRGRADERGEAVMEFDYSTPDGLTAMRWRRSKGWSRSFLGRRGAAQPERAVYLRTLGHVGQPVGVRGAPGRPRLNAARRETPLTSWQVEFAQRMLPFRYSEVVDLSSDGRKLLFAVQEGGAAYSELHMAAGERAILRLSQEIAHVEGALVLIDDVEASLHPWVQQLLMLQLQQLALQNDLQIVVTTHSPIVLDSVPSYGKIFLDRDDTGRVTVRRPYRDLVQDALYGRAGEALNLLCEDDAAEGVLQGVFDHLLTRQGVRREAIRIGRDTGADEFPMHAAAFRKFGRIGDFVFVVDGDKRGSDIEQRIGRAARTDVPVLFLPGGDAPEVWVWDRLRRRAAAAAPELGVDPDDLAERMRRLDTIYDSASDGPSEIAKVKLRGLSEPLRWDPPDVCRLVGRLEAVRADSDVQSLVRDLAAALKRWRAE